MMWKMLKFKFLKNLYESSLDILVHLSLKGNIWKFERYIGPLTSYIISINYVSYIDQNYLFIICINYCEWVVKERVIKEVRKIYC